MRILRWSALYEAAAAQDWKPRILREARITRRAPAQPKFAAARRNHDARRAAARANADEGSPSLILDRHRRSVAERSGITTRSCISLAAQPLGATKPSATAVAL